MAYITKTTDELRAEMKLNIVANVDTITDINVGSTLDMFVTTIAEEVNIINGYINDVYDANRIDTATGDDLEQIGKIVGVTRNVGDNAEGYVTFMRESSTTGNVTISQGDQVSTQPNIESEQLFFNVKADTISYETITDEEHTFVNGIYEYPLNERYIKLINSITGTVSSSAYTFTQGTDYSIEEDVDKVIPLTSSLTTIDDCEATTGWTADDDAGATSLNSSTYYQGSNSLNIIKSGTTNTTFGYHKTLSSTQDFSNKTLFVSIYIADSVTLAKIDNMTIYFGSGGSTTNSYFRTINSSDLTTGWNRVYLDYSNNCTQSNYPDIENINYLKISFNSSAISDTITAGYLLMDFWFISTYENYIGDVVLFDRTATIPDNNTTIKTTYNPNSVEVLVESDDVGVKYNLGINKINYMVSAFSGFSSVNNYEATTGGVDIETDAELKARILDASDLANVATVGAIEANVLALDFVKFARVDNLPEVSITGETHYYVNTTSKYTLSQQVPIDDTNLTVTGTVSSSSYTFVKNTDYILNDDGQIEFGIGGTDPDNNTIFTVDYHANKIGYFDVYVTGYSGSLNSSQITEVEDKIDEVKSAGVIGTVKQPTYISVNVTATITVNSSYDSTTVKDNVETAINDYIDNLEIGDDVLLAGVITAAMGVEGCDNISVSDIGGGGANDYSITDVQIADPGTINIS